MTERLVGSPRRALRNNRARLLSLTIFSPVLLGGCALPPALEIASWALTSFSYAATGKGMGDHAISLAMEEDCAFHRVAFDGDLCRPHGDTVPSDTMLASRDEVGSSLSLSSGPTLDQQAAPQISPGYGAAQAAVMPVDL